MRIAYLDCFSGISGDMFLGALIDAGVSAQILEEAVAALDIGARLEVSRINRSGITATKVDVVENVGRTRLSASEQHEPHIQSHQDEAALSEGKGGTGVSAPHQHPRSHGRSLKKIKEIIRAAKISESARATAIAIFQTLGEAESKIHNSDIEKIHFHEVGAVDAMVDIVCAAVGAEALGVDEIVCSPLNVGGGTVNCAHGTFPVPAPATLELLSDAPIYSSGLQAELVTPTGAAIVKTLVKRFGPFPVMKSPRAGYGAGSRDFPNHANVLRLTVGESEAGTKTSVESIIVLEANLDDLNPQVFGYVMDRLLEEGALDVFAVPVQMKKSRPGTLLTVLCQPGVAEKLTQIIFVETTTLGVRRREEQRQVLARRWIDVSTQWGNVRMKIGSLNGAVSNYAPEYEDCRRIAAEHQVPLKAVMAASIQAYLKSHKGF
jgi:pyridinium-3,5-bisthiocarboxylic acid mononucleotide nickel chelatase